MDDLMSDAPADAPADAVGTRAATDMQSVLLQIPLCNGFHEVTRMCGLDSVMAGDSVAAAACAAALSRDQKKLADPPPLLFDESLTILNQMLYAPSKSDSHASFYDRTHYSLEALLPGACILGGAMLTTNANTRVPCAVVQDGDVFTIIACSVDLAVLEVELYGYGPQLMPSSSALLASMNASSEVCPGEETLAILGDLQRANHELLDNHVLVDNDIAVMCGGIGATLRLSLPATADEADALFSYLYNFSKLHSRHNKMAVEKTDLHAYVTTPFKDSVANITDQVERYREGLEKGNPRELTAARVERKAQIHALAIARGVEELLEDDEGDEHTQQDLTFEERRSTLQLFVTPVMTFLAQVLLQRAEGVQPLPSLGTDAHSFHKDVESLAMAVPALCVDLRTLLANEEAKRKEMFTMESMPSKVTSLQRPEVSLDRLLGVLRNKDSMIQEYDVNSIGQLAQHVLKSDKVLEMDENDLTLPCTAENADKFLRHAPVYMRLLFFDTAKMVTQLGDTQSVAFPSVLRLLLMRGTVLISGNRCIVSRLYDTKF